MFEFRDSLKLLCLAVGLIAVSMSFATVVIAQDEAAPAAWTVVPVQLIEQRNGAFCQCGTSCSGVSRDSPSYLPVSFSSIRLPSAWNNWQRETW